VKRLEIYFDSFYTEKMKEELREYGIDQYFIVPAIHSSWSKTFKHFNTHVWPGTDSILVTYLEDRHAQGAVVPHHRTAQGLGLWRWSVVCCEERRSCQRVVCQPRLRPRGGPRSRSSRPGREAAIVAPDGRSSFSP